MAIRPRGEKRRQRCVMATDSEWTVIGEDAEAEGLSVSEYIVRALLEWRETVGAMRVGSEWGSVG